MPTAMTWDLQAHRGGAGLAPENTLQAFGSALAVGVTTLELDVHVSQDGQPVVTHDRILPDGEFIAWTPRIDLPFCTLDEVFALCAERGAHEVRFNIETKFDALHPDESYPRERFVEVVAGAVAEAGVEDRCSVQSFDWACLDLVARHSPRLGRNVLTNVAYWEVGLAGASPWLAGVDIDDFGGSVVAAAAGRGYDALSPAFALVTPAFVADAHREGLAVIPYTVNEVADLLACLDLGCDGVITDHPERGRQVMADRGMDLPVRYPGNG